MITPVDSPYLAPSDGSFCQAPIPTSPPADHPGRKSLDKQRKALIRDMRKLQRRLYAEDRRSLLLIFQALDAAGKDGTIRAVLSGLNPAGCQVTSFKAPSKEELEHDFLWRTSQRLPERGNIGVFNRSYYEEVLVVRVHPSFLDGQRVARPDDLETLWQWRLQAIREHELHLARSGTVVLKFWLKVGRDEQRKRLLERIEDPDRNWKFNAGDVAERKHWDAYHDAFEQAVAQTARPWAPWYVIPADHKPFMRLQVADIVARTLERIDPQYPVLADDKRAQLDEMRTALGG
ncbi:MAG: polyphosphate kinase 2 family protein [Oligoflexia bacterium]|nr:polyphosphate kinase 2 family protein [Oligoflexia bacterium]